MRNKPFKLALFLFIAAVAFAGCGKKPSPDDRVIAAVSHRKITLKDLRAKIAKMPAYYQTVIDKNKARYLDDMVMEMLLYEEAVRRGVNNDKEVKDVLDAAKKKVVIAKYVKGEVEDKVRITDEDMKKFYDEHKDEFKAPAMWRASHILVANEARAGDILAELSRGASFEDLAKANSIDATAGRGGDIGYFSQGQLVPEFEKECLKLEVGQTSDIVRTQFGYHIIKLTDKKEPAIESFDNEKVARAVEGELKQKRRSELFDELAARLKAKYHVKIEEDAFKSPDEAPKEKESSGKR